VYQVGHCLRLYEDARSIKHKNSITVSPSSIISAIWDEGDTGLCVIKEEKKKEFYAEK